MEIIIGSIEFRRHMISRIRRSLSAQITLWVVAFAIVVMVIILLLIVHFSQVVVNDAGVGSRLLITAVYISLAGVVVLSLLCWLTVRRYLRPLDMLASSAQRIADGKINESVSDTGQRDEIGQLQNSFAMMQRSLAGYISEMNKKRVELSVHNLRLQKAYEKTREADGVKSQFLSRMTTKMVEAVGNIDKLTILLCDHHAEMSKSDLMKLQVEMLTYTDTVTHMLDLMLNGSTLNQPSHDPLIQSE